MNFDTEGFTGESGAAIRKQHPENHMQPFPIANACSQYALQISQLLPDSESKTGLASRLFFARSISHFQAAICLAEGGMTIESMVICRSLIETFFVLNALAEGVVTPAELASQDGASRRSHANALLNRKSTYPGIAPYEDTLRKFIEENAGAIDIKIFALAQKGNTLAAYDGLYRHLSHHAAHPSLSAVDPYLIESSEKQVHAQFRPALEYTPKAVLSACIGILMSCFACEKLGVINSKTSEVGSKLWEEYLTIDEAHNLWG